LEFGGGPIIRSLISAAPYVSESVFSDYIESARKQLVMWKDNKPMIEALTLSALSTNWREISNDYLM